MREVPGLRTEPGDKRGARGADEASGAAATTSDQVAEEAWNRGRPLFGRWVTLVLAAALVLPFAFYRATDSEPFPAIIFPGGAGPGTSIEDGRAQFTSLILIGFDHAGQPVELDTAAFLDPIPPSFVGALASRSFGQDTTSTFDLYVKRVRWTIEGIPRPVPSDAERRAARAWLAEKLADLGLSPDRLSLRYDRFHVDYDTGDIIGRETDRERIIRLD